MTKRVHVVAGIIVREGEVLLAKRPQQKHQGGLWEFPGGKVEQDELPINALKRELAEEVNLKIADASIYLQLNHDYSDKLVQLDFYWIDRFRGEAQGLEGQELRWVALNQIDQFKFPAANVAVVESLLQVEV